MVWMYSGRFKLQSTASRDALSNNSTGASVTLSWFINRGMLDICCPLYVHRGKQQNG